MQKTDHHNDFILVQEFLQANPEFKSTRFSEHRFMSERMSRIDMSTPKTVPDSMVRHIFMTKFGYSQQDALIVEKHHQEGMSAENSVGNLLERYLAEKLRPFGWIWCSGHSVRSIDFIRKNANGTWTALQVKNRDNSENSSSSAIRNGTSIIKWFRSFSKSNRKNWENFPDPVAAKVLSENGFEEFVSQHLTQ